MGVDRYGATRSSPVRRPGDLESLPPTVGRVASAPCGGRSKNTFPHLIGAALRAAQAKVIEGPPPECPAPATCAADPSPKGKRGDPAAGCACPPVARAPGSENRRVIAHGRSLYSRRIPPQTVGWHAHRPGWACLGHDNEHGPPAASDPTCSAATAGINAWATSISSLRDDRCDYHTALHFGEPDMALSPHDGHGRAVSILTARGGGLTFSQADSAASFCRLLSGAPGNNRSRICL